jgi:hypothetical protein
MEVNAMNRLEQDLRRCKAEFGERDTIALAFLLFCEADSKSRRQKIVRTAALVLGAREEILGKTLNKLDEVFAGMTILAPDGQEILKNGEFVWGGGEND